MVVLSAPAELSAERSLPITGRDNSVFNSAKLFTNKVLVKISFAVSLKVLSSAMEVIMIQGFCCVICQKSILGTNRLSARYCGRVCRNKANEARRKEETLRQRNEREVVLKRHEDWLRQFQLELLRRAPPEAGGYQAGLWTGNITYWFPTIPLGVSYRNTLNRTRSTYNFFTIEPFEPPSVALVANYAIRFVHTFSPHPILPKIYEDWRVRIPFSVPMRKLPFNLRAVPRDLR